MKRGILLWSCVLCRLWGNAQSDHRPAENSLINAGCYSSHFLDAFSFRNNPASLGTVQGFSTGMLTERKWMLSELNLYALAATFSVGNGGLGIMLQQYGDADYHEQMLEMGYGKTLGRLEIGVYFGLQRSLAIGYDAKNFGSAAVALRYHVSDKLIAGWELLLPAFGTGGKTITEKGSRIFRMGFGYESGDNLFFAFQVEKESGVPINITPSMEYRYDGKFIFGIGFNGNAGSVFFKTGWEKNRLSLQLYSVYEPLLGFSPGLLMLWRTKNKKG